MRNRGWGIENGGLVGSSRPVLSELSSGDRCDDRSAQRADPTRAAGRGIRALPQRLCVSAVLLLFGLSAGYAQSYSIDWHKIAGGGGTSTNGQYTVSGTIGQADAGGPMTGGNYSLTGGFWALISVVQTPGAPTLTIVPAGPGQATISWTPASTNWVLQETLSLSPANWTNSPSGNTNPIIVPATPPTKFYRLFKP